jgi:hypothetical protein
LQPCHELGAERALQRRGSQRTGGHRLQGAAHGEGHLGVVGDLRRITQRCHRAVVAEPVDDLLDGEELGWGGQGITERQAVQASSNGSTGDSHAEHHDSL